MRRAAIYARISRDEIGDGLGVTRQVKDGQELAAQRGWVVVDTYIDNDVSAARGKPRPEHQRMLRDIEAKRIDAVVVWDLDRLYRLPAELEEFLTLAKVHRLELASVGGDVDLSTEQGILVAGIEAQVGRYESQQNSRRVLRKQQELREAGLPFGGGIRCYGWEPDRLTLIPDEAEEIRHMADMILSGHSLSAIVRELNMRQVQTVSQWMAERPRGADRDPVEGRPWSVTSVRTLLRKPRLVGDLTHKGEVVGRGQWEPILDRETFAKVQTMLGSRARGHRTASTSRRYLLSGIATCGVCGAGLQTGAQNSGNAYRRYRCPAPAKGQGGGVRHGGRNMRALDDYVVSSLFDLLEVLRDSGLGPQEVDPSPEIERLRERLNDVTDQFADDLITAEQFHRLTARFRARIDQLERARPSPADRSLMEWYLGTADRAEARQNWELLDLSQRRMVLSTHLGQRGHIKVFPARVLNKGLDTSTIAIRWSLGNEAAMPE